MLRTILFVTGFGMVLGSVASFHRIDDPFAGDGPVEAFTALFWFVLGTVIAAWAARRVLAGITRMVATSVEGEGGSDFLTLWIRYKKADLSARIRELDEKGREKDS